ncbi:hypothetical protein HYQ46_011737 [Verticillium longisporum]|nr:hypothetical protein HYQ46_011737 [Verticillium longisporum]
MGIPPTAPHTLEAISTSPTACFLSAAFPLPPYQAKGKKQVLGLVCATEVPSPLPTNEMAWPSEKHRGRITLQPFGTSLSQLVLGVSSWVFAVFSASLAFS